MSIEEAEARIKQLEEENMIIRYKYYCARLNGIRTQKALNDTVNMLPKGTKVKTRIKHCLRYNFYTGELGKSTPKYIFNL